MKKNTLKAWAILTLSFFGLASANAADRLLPLNGVNLFSSSKVTYANPVITYLEDIPGEEIWGHAGWEWSTGEDFSEYSYIVAEFDASGLTNPDPDPTKIQLQITYFDGDKKEAEVRLHNTIVCLALDPTKSSAVKEIFIKSQYAGDIKLHRVYATKVESNEIPFFLFTDWDKGSYDGVSQTFTAADGWGRISCMGMTTFLTNYESFVLEFDQSSLDPVDNWIQVIVKAGVMGEVENSENVQNGKIVIDLTGKVIVSNIHIKLKKPGSVTLIKAYFTYKEKTGIYNLKDDGSTIAGYYSILGAKLSEEPASGVFIVKYSNGKAVKIVK